MSLAYVGAHRVGKTTLARAFAERNDLPFVQTGATEVFAALGLDPKVEYPIAERASIQSTILLAFERQWEVAAKAHRYFVSDRSPLDLAMYMLADVSRTTLVDRPEVAGVVTRYVERCIEATNRFFSTVILVQPGIQLVEAPGKAPACPAYMEHLNMLALGLMNDSRLETYCFKLQRPITDLDERVAATEKVVVESVEKHQKWVQRALQVGELVVH